MCSKENGYFLLTVGEFLQLFSEMKVLNSHPEYRFKWHDVGFQAKSIVQNCSECTELVEFELKVRPYSLYPEE